MRYSVIWSSSHKLWLVYDREQGQYVGHSSTKAGATMRAKEAELASVKSVKPEASANRS